MHFSLLNYHFISEFLCDEARTSDSLGTTGTPNLFPSQPEVFFKLVNFWLFWVLFATWAFSSGEWGLLFIAVHGLLIVVASLVVSTDSTGHAAPVVAALMCAW